MNKSTDDGQPGVEQHQQMAEEARKEALARMTHVLIIDDSPTDSAIMRDYLHTNGFDVKTVATGQEALDFLGYATTDIILLDLILPDIHGYDLFRKLRELPTRSPIPIIMVTARGTKPEEYYGRMLGADHYFKKPVRYPLLLEAIRQLVAG